MESVTRYNYFVYKTSVCSKITITNIYIYIKLLRAKNYDKDDLSHTCSPCINYFSLLRNKRCILAYLQYRLEKLQKLRWETGSVIPDHIKHLLGPIEIELFQNYDNLVGDYMKSFDLDLTAVTFTVSLSLFSSAVSFFLSYSRPSSCCWWIWLTNYVTLFS